MALLLQYTPLSVYAKSEVEVKQSENQLSIENEYISREFSNQDNHLKTTSLVNKRIGETLTSQIGSEDFLINTIVSTEDTEVKPVM